MLWIEALEVALFSVVCRFHGSPATHISMDTQADLRADAQAQPELS